MPQYLRTDLRVFVAKFPGVSLAINVCALPALFVWLWVSLVQQIPRALVVVAMIVILAIWAIVAMITWRTFDRFRPLTYALDLVFPFSYFVALWLLWQVVRSKHTIDLSDRP